MTIFITGLCIGLCLCLAGGITVLRTAFARISQSDISPETGTDLPALFHALVTRQDKILSALLLAYGFFICSTLVFTFSCFFCIRFWPGCSRGL